MRGINDMHHHSYTEKHPISTTHEQGWLSWFIWFVSFIWLDSFNQTNQRDQINKKNQPCLSVDSPTTLG